MKTHEGSCHCGRVQFEIDSDVASLGVCNCSFCRRRNALVHSVRSEHFRLIKGAPGGPDGAATYGTGIFLHHFCPNCGIQCFTYQDAEGRMGQRYNVNMNCFDPTLTDGLIPYEFDGASMPDDSRAWQSPES